MLGGKESHWRNSHTCWQTTCCFSLVYWHSHLVFFFLQQKQKKWQFTTIGLWIVIYSHFFLLIILFVLYSLKCGQFHFNAPFLPAPRHLNNLLHFSLFITWQSFLSSTLQQFLTSRLSCSSFTWCALNAPLFSSLFRTTRWWFMPEAPRSKEKEGEKKYKKRPARCVERKKMWHEARKEVWEI